MRPDVLSRNYAVVLPDKSVQQVPVTLGDTVWYFWRGDTKARPSIAMVNDLCDQGQLNLTVWDKAANTWVSKTGVCIHGDVRLTNPNVLQRGVWLPRAMWPQLIEE